MTNDLSTLICLFHHQDQAQAALEDVLKAGIPEANVTLIGVKGSTIAASKSTLIELNVPDKDVQHLLDGIEGGGAVLAVSAISDYADRVENIFAEHKADKIDEARVADDMSAQALPLAGTTGDAYSTPTLAAVDSYDPLMPSELEDEGEELVLVTGTVDTNGVAHIDSVQPVATLPTEQDVDPRELGLDARMKPTAGKSELD